MGIFRQLEGFVREFSSRFENGAEPERLATLPTPDEPSVALSRSACNPGAILMRLAMRAIRRAGGSALLRPRSTSSRTSGSGDELRCAPS